MYRSEAHLSPLQRSQALVRWVGKPRRKGWALAVFWVLILLNEMRGIAVAKEIWPLIFG
jgi:hypothetical protein